MNAKEYFSQATRIDQRINSKLEQVHSLRELATKATSTLTDIRVDGSRNVRSLEETIAKMVDLETEINADVDALVDLKRDIVTQIKRLTNPEYQIILELRYLCFMRWDSIAVNLCYSSPHMFRLHDAALREIEKNMRVDLLE